MRLEGQAKAGYYPTPLEVAQLIGSFLTLGGEAHLLDPCCGPGTALETVNVRMKGHYRSITHGVELESERAAEAAHQLNNVLVGDSLKARVQGRFSLLYLNPPYDQADGKRLELTFLWHWQKALLPGGVLVCVVPERYLGEYEATLTAQFEDLSVYRFPGEHYDAFKQVVVFGVKRPHTALPGRLPDVSGDLSQRCANYTVPESLTTPQLYLAGQDPELLVAEVRTKGCWRRAWDLLSPPDPQTFRPLLPPRKGHVALMIASGLTQQHRYRGGRAQAADPGQNPQRRLHLRRGRRERDQGHRARRDQDRGDGAGLEHSEANRGRLKAAGSKDGAPLGLLCAGNGVETYACPATEALSELGATLNL